MGIPIDPNESADEHYGNLRITILDMDPITSEVVRFERANLDPQAGAIDLTSTPGFSLILECREETGAFDGLARSCAQLME